MTSETFQQPLLQVAQLSVSFPSPQGLIEAVNALSFDVHAGEVLALVGESGSGKSVTARTLVGLAGAGAAVRAESLILHGHDGLSQNLLACDARRWQQLRGREIGFVLQDALTSLDPLRRIGQEVAEPLLTHRLERGAAVRERVAELLTQTGIPDPHNRMAQYAHELSGGLRQRALIASALAAGPRLLIADEPTTALDATVQKQVLNVFRALADAGHGVLLITHDLSVVADIADRVVVMRQGKAVESGKVRQVLHAPQHPYTRRLLAAIPSAGTRGTWLTGNDPLGQTVVRENISTDSTTPVLPFNLRLTPLPSQMASDLDDADIRSYDSFPSEPSYQPAPVVFTVRNFKLTKERSSDVQQLVIMVQIYQLQLDEWPDW